MVKSLPEMQETSVQSLSREDPLEEGMATHSSILAWRIPWIEEPGGLQSMGSQTIRHDWATKHKHNTDLTQSLTHLTAEADHKICENVKGPKKQKQSWKKWMSQKSYNSQFQKLYKATIIKTGFTV